MIGNPVTFNLTKQGTLIGPYLHETQQGAYYILFGLGKAIKQNYIIVKILSTKEDSTVTTCVQALGINLAADRGQVHLS